MSEELPSVDVVAKELRWFIASWRPNPNEQEPPIEYWTACALL